MTLPTLALWIGILLRMLISKDRDKFYGLIVICILMIISMVSSIFVYQMEYTDDDRDYNEDLYHIDLSN